MTKTQRHQPVRCPGPNQQLRDRHLMKTHWINLSLYICWRSFLEMFQSSKLGIARFFRALSIRIPNRVDFWFLMSFFWRQTPNTKRIWPHSFPSGFVFVWEIRCIWEFLYRQKLKKTSDTYIVNIGKHLVQTRDKNVQISSHELKNLNTWYMLGTACMLR